MHFDIISIFPEIFGSYLKASLLARAQKKRLVKINVHNLRKWAKDRHQTVDDKPFGGGRGMVMKIEPIYKAIKALKKNLPAGRQEKTKVVLFSPRGKKFTQAMATRWSKSKHLIFVCGRYEGVDERVANHLVDEIISIGDYVLMGGELPAMIVLETIVRLLPGVVGKSEALRTERITKEKGFLEYPQYTRPEVFGKWPVPKVLLSGHHQKIEQWRAKHSKTIE